MCALCLAYDRFASQYSESVDTVQPLKKSFVLGAVNTADVCAKTSLLPSSGVMNRNLVYKP